MPTRLEARSERLARLEGRILGIQEHMTAEGRESPTPDEWARIMEHVEPDDEEASRSSSEEERT